MNAEDFDLSVFDCLKFEEERHLYEIDGEEIPSVTTIMGPINSDKYEGISQKVLERASEKGTAVHDGIEFFLKYGVEDIETEYRPYFDSFLDWKNDYKPSVLASEVKMFHKALRYAGTADLLCEIGGKLVLVDYKSTTEIYEMTCRIQLEAYWQALSSHGITADEKWILHLKKDGSYTVAKFPTKDLVAWRTFGALKTVYDYIQSYKGRKSQFMEIIRHKNFSK